MGCRRWRTRLAELERHLPKPLPLEDPQREKRRLLVGQRLVRLCKEACSLLTEEEQIKVAESLRQWAEAEQGPYARWFRELFPRPLPFARVGSRDHETTVGGMVVSRLRPYDAGVSRLRIAVPASAFVFLEGCEVVARKDIQSWSPSLVRLSRLFPELSRMWGLSE